MTPFELDILLHFYSMQSRHRVEVENPPIWPETRDWMLRTDLIYPFNGGYRTTDRGAALIEEILRTPLPTRKWVVEREPEGRP